MIAFANHNDIFKLAHVGLPHYLVILDPYQVLDEMKLRFINYFKIMSDVLVVGHDITVGIWFEDSIEFIYPILDFQIIILKDLAIIDGFLQEHSTTGTIIPSRSYLIGGGLCISNLYFHQESASLSPNSSHCKAECFPYQASPLVSG